MAMTVSELQVVVSADTSKAESGLASLGSKVGSVGSAIGTAFGAAAIGGIAAFGAGLTASVAAASTFESSMSAIKAVSGATGAEMEQLSALALQLGADTSFSASEAATGIGELIKAGVSVGDVLGGAASASLNLAAAGAVSVGEAAEIAANAMNQFGLKGADLAHVSDLIAGAANASAIDVNDFKFSLAAVGAVANTVGFSFDDTATAIALLGQAGIKGSDAGTSLKTMLLNLQPATDKQTALFRELGLITADGANRFFDASGKVKSMAEVAGTLQAALAGQTQQQKLATLETIFGSDAIRAAAVFANQGAEGFNTMAEAMGKVSAESVAAERLNNLKGSVEQLTGSLETAGIKIGTAFLPGLKAIVDGTTAIVNESAPALEAFAASAAAALVGAGQQIADAWRTAKQAFAGEWLPSDQIPPFVNAVGIAATKLRELRDVLAEAVAKASAMGAWDTVRAAFSNLGDAAKIANDRIDDIGASLDRASGPASKTANAADVLAGAIKGAALGFEFASIKLKDLTDGIGTSIAAMIDFATGLQRIGQAMDRLKTGDFPGAIQALKESGEAFAAAKAAADEFSERGLRRTSESAQVMAELVGLHMTATRDAVETNMAAATAAVSEGSSGMQAFMEANVGSMQAATETGMQGVATSVATGMGQATGAVETQGAASVAAIDAMGSGMSASASSGMASTVGAIEAQTPAGVAAIDAMGSGMTSSLQGQAGPMSSAGSSVVSAAISAAESAASGASSIGSSIGSGIQSGIMSAAGSIASAAANVVRRALQAARDAIDSDSPSKVFADQVGKPIVQGIQVGMDRQTPPLERQMGQLLQPPSGLGAGFGYGRAGAAPVAEHHEVDIRLGDEIVARMWVRGYDINIERGTVAPGLR